MSAEQRLLPARLPLLDALRTIAAVGVMLFHLGGCFHLPGLFSRGYLLVDLFFCLSGFVLTLAYEPKFPAGMSAFSFLEIRVRRLWPLIALGSLAGAIAYAPQAPLDQVLMLLTRALILIPLFNPAFGLFPLNGPQWSLFWEVIVNFLHGSILWRLDNRKLLALAVLFGAGLVASIVWVGSCRFGPNATLWEFGVFRVGWSYIVGILMARTWQKRPQSLRQGGDWRLALLAPIVAMLALQMLPGGDAIGDIVAVLVLLPAILWYAVNCKVPAGTEQWLRRFGELSFPIYALHQPAMFILVFLPRDGLSALLAGALAVVLSLAVATWGGPLGLGSSRRAAQKA